MHFGYHVLTIIIPMKVSDFLRIPSFTRAKSQQKPDCFIIKTPQYFLPNEDKQTN